MIAKQIFYGNTALDIHLQDTYFVLSNAFPFLFVTIVFAIFAATYFLFDKIFNRKMSDTLGYLHFWLSFLGISLLLLPVTYSGLAGMPRRYYDYNDWEKFNAYIKGQYWFFTVVAVLLAVAQLVFVFNFCYSMFKQKK